MTEDAKAEKSKYYYYEKSVQSTESEIDFITQNFIKLRHRPPVSLREDFCGTFLLSYEWVKSGQFTTACAVDIDSAPLNYGKENHFNSLAIQQKNRCKVEQKNVLQDDEEKYDVICALNFSYFVFKDRKILKKYFDLCRKRLFDQGILVLDCFGGAMYQSPNSEETEEDGFTFVWDQKSFNPIDNHAVFNIHFNFSNHSKMKNAFTYDWRMWSPPELKDLLEEVGFKKVRIFWEGTTEDGEGDGVFKETSVGDECDSWVVYIVAEY